MRDDGVSASFEVGALGEGHMRGEASRVSASYRLTPVSEGKSDSFQRTGSFEQFIKKLHQNDSVTILRNTSLHAP